MASQQFLLRCKSCGHEWAPEKISADSLVYCPKCGMIGDLHDQFELLNP